MITEQEAIDTAKRVAAEQGWYWQDPARALFRRAWFGPGGKWEVITTGPVGAGPMIRVLIDGETGEVLEKRCVPMR
jgi:hypothetical protein